MKAKIEVELQEFMGSDASIANAAWTSTYNKERREDKYDDPAKVAELVPRLIRDGHSVPLESVILRFWIRHPIFNDRQHMTHRIASHNGLSARYRTMPGDWFGLPEDVKHIADIINPGNGTRMAMEYDAELAHQYSTYEKWVDYFKRAEREGIITNAAFKRARESVRGVLGTAFMVERTSILNLRSFANYQYLRNSDHAQKEIKSVAQQMLEEVKGAGVAPIAIRTLEEMGWKL